MPVPNTLEVECTKCKVAATCPARGSSPLLKDGKRVALCGLIGGYGRVPVDASLLSPESLKASRRDGECLTLANVPRLDPDSGRVYYELVKVFAPANLHAREKNVMTVDSIYPKSHKQ